MFTYSHEFTRELLSTLHFYVLYILFHPSKLQIFGTKLLPRRRFLQHYYRDTFIESHRKLIDISQISYGGRLIRRQLYLSCQIQKSGISDKLFDIRKRGIRFSYILFTKITRFSYKRNWFSTRFSYIYAYLLLSALRISGIIHTNLRHNLRHAKTFFKKILSRAKLSKYYTSRVLYIPIYSLNSQIFGTKPLLRRRFLQHYYRGTNT